MPADQPEQQHGFAQQQAAPSSKAPLEMSTVVWSVTKAALLGTVLGIIGLLPVAAAAYAAWLHCPKLLAAAALAAEACFALYYFFVITKQLNAIPDQHNPPADYDPQQLVASFLKHMARVDDIQGYLSQWFLDAPYDSIRHDNVKELVAFALFFKTPQQVQEQGLMAQLDVLLAQLSAMHDLQLPPGYNPDVKFMSHLWGETPHMYRPLFFYIAMEIIELLCWGILACCGFKRYSMLGCTYYTWGLPEPTQQQQQQQRQQGTGKEQQQPQGCAQQQLQNMPDGQQVDGKSQRQQSRPDQWKQRPSGSCSGSAPPAAARVPLLVLHGVGAGLLPYLGVVLNLTAAGQPMVLPVWKQVSMRLMRHIPTVDDSVGVVLAALQRHGLGSVAVLGHSYGSLVAARLVRVAPQAVRSLAVVDPVCFAMHMPNLVKYFLYSAHVSGNWVADAFIALLRSEIHCARNFTRNFFWATINLFDEHLPEHTLVVLSGTDLLCPTAYVRQWLEGHTSATVLYHATASHGAGLLLHLPWQCTILNSVLRVIGQAGDAGGAADAAAVAETAAAGPDRAAVVSAGHGPAAGAVGGEDAAYADALCCVAAADARVFAEAGCCSDDEAGMSEDGVGEGGGRGILAGGSCRLESSLRSSTGPASASDSNADSDERSSASDLEDTNACDVADLGSSGGRRHGPSKPRAAGVHGGAAAGTGDAGGGGGGGDRSSREGDGLWGLGGSFTSGPDQAVDLELLKEAASGLAASTIHVAAMSAGSLASALQGSASSPQQLQRAAQQDPRQRQGPEQALLDLRQRQQGRGRQGLVRRAQSCGADAVRDELWQRDGSSGTRSAEQPLPSH
ncbi:hypothetical protein COO60DRAFT_1698505 [Scenedesmus sp. NREL 46B-D3]|nr:hypothetical protein COO60DRAFT_1698505 [Scenedesmus sp. NREL 46B-D3]